MTEKFDQVVDVLVVGSGGGGMTAALAADAAGLDTLVVEKSRYFGGSTALSGGGIWVPGAPSQRQGGLLPDPDGVFEYLRQITDGLVSDARLRQYVDTAPEMMEFLEKTQPVVRVRLEARLLPTTTRSFPAAPSGAARSTCPPSTCASSVTRSRTCCSRWRWHRRESGAPQGSSAVLPGPAELARQSRSGEADLADVPGAGVRRPDGRDRAVAGGAVAAGDEGARHPAVAGLADDRVDHRRRRHRDRRGGGT